MFRKVLPWFGSGALLGVGLLISSCGQDVCVFGQGDCTQELSTTTLTLTSSATSVTVSGTLTFTASGGTTPYIFTVIVGSGTVAAVSTTAATFTAPATAATNCVRVTDASSNIADRCVTVQ